MIRYMTDDNKNMSNGMRDFSGTPLTEEEIEFIKTQIRRIGADISVFVFNDPAHMKTSTCYNFIDDRIYVTRNVFPDTKYGSTHPRDVMSVAAVLAHEYYGHRAYRDEYLHDYNIGPTYHTTELWKDECRASITAAKTTPNLSELERSNLVMDAIYRAQEFNHRIEMDDFMKEVLYGYTSGEKNIAYDVTPITYVSEKGEKGITGIWNDNRDMSEMRNISRDYYNFER